MKPRITLVRTGLWSCTGESITCNGVSPGQAYNRWHAAAGETVQAAEQRAFKLPPPRVATPLTIHSDYNETTTGGALPGYSESMVRRIGGTVQMHAWVPPKALRINQARAAAHQPPMKSIASRVVETR